MTAEGLFRVPLFRTLVRPRLEELARDAEMRDVSPGQVVAYVGAPALHLVIVESGSLTATRDTAAGLRVRVRTVAGPCTLDKSATLHEAVHTANWTAVSPCRVRLLPVQVFRTLLDHEPTVRDHVLRNLAAEVNALRRSRTRSAAPDPVAMVADWLIEAGYATGQAIRLAGGQQGVGEELGLSRVTVNRALAALAAAGVVRVRPRLVDVLDPARLTAASIDGRGAIAQRSI